MSRRKLFRHSFNLAHPGDLQPRLQITHQKPFVPALRITLQQVSKQVHPQADGGRPDNSGSAQYFQIGIVIPPLPGAAACSIFHRARRYIVDADIAVH